MGSGSSMGTSATGLESDLEPVLPGNAGVRKTSGGEPPPAGKRNPPAVDGKGSASGARAASSSTTCTVAPQHQGVLTTAVSGAKAFGIKDVIDAHQNRFDRKCGVFRELLGVDVVLLTLFDKDTQYFVARDSVPAFGDGRKIPVATCDTFCLEALRKGSMYIADTTKHPTYQGGHLVRGPPHIRSYAGTVLGHDDGTGIGTLCALTLGDHIMDSGVHAKIIKCGLAMADDVIQAYQRRQAASATEREAEKLANNMMVACCRDLVVVTQAEPNARVLYCNSYLSNVLGHASDELIGCSLLELGLPDERRSFSKRIRAVLKGRLLDPWEHQLRHRGGHYVWVESTFEQANDRVIIVCRSIEERRRRYTLEKELLVMKARHDSQMSSAVAQEAHLKDMEANRFMRHEANGRLTEIGYVARQMEMRLVSAVNDTLVDSTVANQLLQSTDDLTKIVDDTLDTLQNEQLRRNVLNHEHTLSLKRTNAVKLIERRCGRVRARNFSPDPFPMLSVDQACLGALASNMVAASLQMCGKDSTLSFTMIMLDEQSSAVLRLESTPGPCHEQFLDMDNTNTIFEEDFVPPLLQKTFPSVRDLADSSSSFASSSSGGSGSGSGISKARQQSLAEKSAWVAARFAGAMRGAIQCRADDTKFVIEADIPVDRVSGGDSPDAESRRTSGAGSIAASSHPDGDAGSEEHRDADGKFLFPANTVFVVLDDRLLQRKVVTHILSGLGSYEIIVKGETGEEITGFVGFLLSTVRDNPEKNYIAIMDETLEYSDASSSTSRYASGSEMAQAVLQQQLDNVICLIRSASVSHQDTEQFLSRSHGCIPVRMDGDFVTCPINRQGDTVADLYRSRFIRQDHRMSNSTTATDASEADGKRMDECDDAGRGAGNEIGENVISTHLVYASLIRSCVKESRTSIRTLRDISSWPVAFANLDTIKSNADSVVEYVTSVERKGEPVDTSELKSCSEELCRVANGIWKTGDGEHSGGSMEYGKPFKRPPNWDDDIAYIHKLLMKQGGELKRLGFELAGDDQSVVSDTPSSFTTTTQASKHSHDSHHSQSDTELRVSSNRIEEEKTE